MVSFTSLSILLLSAVGILHASPIGKRDVPIEKCTSIANGTLHTSNGVSLQLLDEKLTYGGSLAVEFHACTPNFGGYDNLNGGPIEGKIYIPSTGKCLTTSDGAAPPFKFSEDECEYSNDSGTTFSNFLKQSNGSIYFVGITQADGSYVYYGDQCPSGHFGLPSSTTSGVAEFQCVDNGNVIGLSI